MSEIGNKYSRTAPGKREVSIAVAEVALQCLPVAMALPHRAHPPAPQLLPSAATHGNGPHVKNYKLMNSH